MKSMRSSCPLAAIILGLAIVAMAPAQNASASMLQIVPSSPTLLPGQSETISVLFTSTINFNFTAADIEIAFDNTRFTISNVQLGSLDSGPGFSIFPGNTSTGLLQASISTSSTGAPIIAGQVGTLETFTLTALANAPAGGNLGDINLLANVNRTITAVYSDPTTGNQILLTPTPTNGYDATIDGTVIVGPMGTVVPEPASLILMGLGGGTVLLTTFFRKKKNRPALVG